MTTDKLATYGQWQIQRENPAMAPIQFRYRLWPPPTKTVLEMENFTKQNANHKY